MSFFQKEPVFQQIPEEDWSFFEEKEKKILLSKNYFEWEKEEGLSLNGTEKIRRSIEDLLNDTEQRRFDELAKEPEIDKKNSIDNTILLEIDDEFDPWIGEGYDRKFNQEGFHSEDFSEYDLDEYSENLRYSVADDISIGGKLDRDTRASQVAIEVISQYDLDRSYDILFKEIFGTYGWGNTRVVIENFLKKGISERSISLAYNIRILWRKYDEFNTRALSWSVAMNIVQYFDETMEIEEIEVRLFELYLEWKHSFVLGRKYKHFLFFVQFLLQVNKENRWAWVDPYRDYLEDDSNDDLRCIRGSLLYKKLNKEYELCDIWLGPSQENWLGPLEQRKKKCFQSADVV